MFPTSSWRQYNLLREYCVAGRSWLSESLQFYVLYVCVLGMELNVPNPGAHNSEVAFKFFFFGKTYSNFPIFRALEAINIS